MLKIVKVGGLTVGAGLVVGACIIGWMRANPTAAPVSSSSGGSLVLGASASPSASTGSAVDLHVSSPTSVAASGGAANTLLGGTSGGGGSNAGGNSGAGSSDQPTPTPSSSAPSPADFAQYDKYSDCKKYPNALFGDEVKGTGIEVKVGTTLNVLYRGWLTSGLSFDASTDPSKPFVFREGDHKVIAGWEEGLLGMKVGGIRRLIIPPCAGYGPEGHAPIPPNAVLVFDVQLTAAQ